MLWGVCGSRCRGGDPFGESQIHGSDAPETNPLGAEPANLPFNQADLGIRQSTLLLSCSTILKPYYIVSPDVLLKDMLQYGPRMVTGYGSHRFRTAILELTRVYWTYAYSGAYHPHYYSGLPHMAARGADYDLAYKAGDGHFSRLVCSLLRLP